MSDKNNTTNTLLTEIETALHAILHKKSNPNRRRQLAQALRTIAEKQERLADAETRIGSRLREAQRESQRESQPKKRTGRPRGSGEEFLYWYPESPTRGTLHISARLWYALGSPERVDPQAAAGYIVLRSCVRPDGYAVSRPTGKRQGNPRISLSEEVIDILGLTYCPKGRIPAHTIENNTAIQSNTTITDNFTQGAHNDESHYQ